MHCCANWWQFLCNFQKKWPDINRLPKKGFYQLMPHICATRLVKLCNLKKMVCQFKMNMCVDAKLKATSCATTCIVVPTDDSFLCNFQKSDQASKEHKKKTLLEKNKENSLVICRTHQERWYPSWSPWQLEYYPMHSIVSRSCLLGCHVRAHQGIVSAPDPTKEKPSSVIIMSISANYNCTKRTRTYGSGRFY